MGNMEYALRVAKDQAGERVLIKPMARESLQQGARAIMQLWQDIAPDKSLLEQMELIAQEISERRKREALA